VWYHAGIYELIKLAFLIWENEEILHEDIKDEW